MCVVASASPTANSDHCLLENEIPTQVEEMTRAFSVCSGDIGARAISKTLSSTSATQSFQLIHEAKYTGIQLICSFYNRQENVLSRRKKCFVYVSFYFAYFVIQFLFMIINLTLQSRQIYERNKENRDPKAIRHGSTHLLSHNSRDLSEFESSLVYIMSSRSAKTMW